MINNCMKKKLSYDQVIDRLKKLYNNTYDLSMVNYTGYMKNITLICSEHGPWSQMAQTVFYGKGCPSCNFRKSVMTRTYNQLKTTEKFIEEARQIHGDKFDYSLVIYKNTDTKIKIICPCHGEFLQLPWGHLKYGCKQCNIHTSKAEEEWIKSLNNSNILRQYKIPDHPYIVDGFDPCTKTIYEFYGDYWHGNPLKFDANKINYQTKNKLTFGELYHLTMMRENILRQSGYTIVSIWESEWAH